MKVLKVRASFIGPSPPADSAAKSAFFARLSGFLCNEGMSKAMPGLHMKQELRLARLRRLRLKRHVRSRIGDSMTSEASPPPLRLFRGSANRTNVMRVSLWMRLLEDDADRIQS